MNNILEWGARTNGKILTDDDVWEWLAFDADGNAGPPWDRSDPIRQLVMRRTKLSLEKIPEIAARISDKLYGAEDVDVSGGLADLLKK